MNIKVAVIDSGIELNHEAFRKNQISGNSIVKTGDQWEKRKGVFDSSGHGTACTSVIVNECPNVDIVSIGILDLQGRSNLSALEFALESLLDTDISIINMSLSFNTVVDKKLYQICQKLSAQDITIIASLDNGSNVSYPAAFDNVIGVQNGVLEEENGFWFCKHRPIQCVIDCVAPVVAIPPNEYTMIFPCNSIAAAKLTGIISTMLWNEQVSKISFDTLCNWMQSKAIRTQWEEAEVYERFRIPQKDTWSIADDDPTLNRIYKAICKYFKEKFSYDRLCDGELLTNNGSLKMEQVIPFLKFVEQEMNIKMDYLKINRYHLITVGTLAQYIKSL